MKATTRRQDLELSRSGDLFALPGAVYALALPTVLLLVLPHPGSPVMDLAEGGWSLVIYLWLLLSGFVLISHERLQASVRRLRWLSLALALVSIGTYLVLRFRFSWPTFGTARYALVLGLEGFGSWCWIVAILGFGIEHLDFSTPFVKYTNEAVLPFYILHQTVLLCVGYFVVQWAIPDLLKWMVILLASLAIIVVLYEFLVRRFNVLRFLFGMKPLPKAPAAQSEGAVPVSHPGIQPSP